MKILHLANHCDEVGNGIMNVAVDIACLQAELGHDVAFASGGGSFVQLLYRYGVAHHTIEQPWRRPLRLSVAAIGLHRLLRSFKPDVVHAHMMTGAVLGRALRGRTNYRLVTTVHNEWQHTAILMGLGDRVIAVSDAVRVQLRSRGLPERKLSVVRNATLGSPRRRCGGSEPRMELEHPAIVSVAGLNYRKGIAELIAAFAVVAPGHPTARLYLIGEGPDRPAFERQASALPCRDRIVFAGFVSDPRPYLAGSDIFVLASRADPCPLVIPEAREAGCAIVATLVDGIPESLDEGRAGILVPPRDPAALASSIDHLLCNHEEREIWRQRARENLAWLHLDRAVAETLAIYSQVLSDGRTQLGRKAAPAE
jgi:glycosyltransferase involved in cell wall biosynthesis